MAPHSRTYQEYIRMTDTEWDYREDCRLCRAEGGHDVEQRPHQLDPEGEEL